MKLAKVKAISVGSSIHSHGKVIAEKDNEIVAKKAGVEQSELDSGVTLSIGATQNMGDFYSIKVNVSVHIPCENSVDARSAAIQQASAEGQQYLIDEMSITRQNFNLICGN